MCKDCLDSEGYIIESPCDPYVLFVKNLFGSHLAEFIFSLTTIADTSIFINMEENTAEEIQMLFLSYSKVVGELVANIFDLNVRRADIPEREDRRRPAPKHVEKKEVKKEEPKPKKKVETKKKVVHKKKSTKKHKTAPKKKATADSRKQKHGTSGKKTVHKKKVHRKRKSAKGKKKVVQKKPVAEKK